MKRTLLIESVDTYGNETTQAVANANPNATNSNLDTWVRKFMSLSKQTYRDTIVRDEKSLNEELSD